MKPLVVPVNIFFAVAFFFTFSLNLLANEHTLVLLTPQKQEYLEKLGSLSMCVDPDWLPYEHVDEEGRFTGIAADLVTLVSQRLGIPFDLVRTRVWSETLEVSRAGGCKKRVSICHDWF